MDQKEFQVIKATFPWTEKITSLNGVGGFVQVIDNAGQEVPIFTMTAFLEMITRKLTNRSEATQQETHED